MIEATIRNIDAATERGFKLDTGELVVVKVTRPAVAGDGAVIAITVSARLTDADGNTLVIAGEPAQMPGHTISFLVESLGSGSVVALPQIAAQMEAEARKARGFAAALRSLGTFAVA